MGTSLSSQQAVACPAVGIKQEKGNQQLEAGSESARDVVTRGLSGVWLIWRPLTERDLSLTLLYHCVRGARLRPH